MDSQDIADAFESLKIVPGANGPRMTMLEVDDRAPNNVVARADSPEQMHQLLIMRFGASELAAMLHDPAMTGLHRDVNGMPDWFHAAQLIEKHWRHEYRNPTMTEVPWRARFADKAKADTAIHPWQVIGLSSQGWAAALAARGDSAKRYLFCRRATDDVETPWQQVPGFSPLPAGRNPYATNIDGSTVSLLFASSHQAPDGTHINDFHVVVVALDRPTDEPRVISLPTGAPDAIDVCANDRRVLVVHKDGALTIVHPSTSITYSFVPFCPVVPETPTKPTRTNPMSGEPLDVNEDGAQPVMVRHDVTLAVHDQCDPDVIALSTARGWIVRARVPPAATPADRAPQLLADTLEFCVMGEDPKLGDLKYAHPSQEPAASLCVRSVSGGDVTLAQCGWHVSYRSDSAMHCPVPPRYPAYQAADAGPMNCIALLGTTMVVHTKNNKLLIASMVPDLQDPSREPVRFRSGTHGQDSPIAASPVPYPSLCITMDHIYWLLPDGTLILSTPCTEKQHASLMEQAKQKPAK